MYLVSANSSIFFFGMDFASFSYKYYGMMLSLKQFIGSYMSVTTYNTSFALSNFISV